MSAHQQGIPLRRCLPIRPIHAGCGLLSTSSANLAQIREAAGILESSGHGGCRRSISARDRRVRSSKADSQRHTGPLLCMPHLYCEYEKIAELLRAKNMSTCQNALSWGLSMGSAMS